MHIRVITDTRVELNQKIELEIEAALARGEKHVYTDHIINYKPTADLYFEPGPAEPAVALQREIAWLRERLAAAELKAKQGA